MPLVDRPILGRAFRFKRLSTGLSLREFCRKHHLDPSRYAKLERGRWIPSRRATLEKYALAIGVEPGSRDAKALEGIGLLDRLRQNPEYQGLTVHAVLAKLRSGSSSPPSEAELVDSLFKRIGKLPGGPSEMPPLRRVLP